MIETESKARVHVEAEVKRARDEAGEMRVLNRPKIQIFCKSESLFRNFQILANFRPPLTQFFKEKVLKNTDIITLDCRNADSPDFAPSRDQAEIQAPRSANFKQKFGVPYPAVANRIDSKPAVVKQKHGASRPVTVKQKLAPCPTVVKLENGAPRPVVLEQKTGLRTPAWSNRNWGFTPHRVPTEFGASRVIHKIWLLHASPVFQKLITLGSTCCEEHFRVGFTLLRKSKSRPLCLSVQK